MIEVKDLEARKPFDKLTLLEVGKEKSEKSRCAATAPKPILFFDFDLRADALSGRKGVFALTLRDPAPHMQPTAFNEMLDVLTRLEQGADLRDLNFTRVDKGVKPATLVDDSVSTMAKSAGRFALYTNGDIRRRLTFGGGTEGKGWSVDFVKNFDGWNAEMTAIENVILRQLAMPYHFIATLHETEEETEDSSPEKKKFTGRIGPFPARYQLLFKYFNELWHFEQAPPVASGVQGQNMNVYQAQVQVRPNYRCPWAATNLELDQFELPDINAMIAKHMSRVKSLPQLVAPKAVSSAN